MRLVLHSPVVVRCGWDVDISLHQSLFAARLQLC